MFIVMSWLGLEMQVCLEHIVLVWFLVIFFPLLHSKEYSCLEAIYEAVIETGAHEYMVGGTAELIRSSAIPTQSQVSS